jgi:hypothetical protein
MNRLNNCNLIDFPKIINDLGNLTFIESLRHIPFQIQRIYYLTDVPKDSERGGHAHKALHQIILPISGSFDIHIDDGFNKKTITLNQDDKGLYVCPLIWRTLNNFSANAICLVLASDYFLESDYFRVYDEFINFIKSESD